MNNLIITNSFANALTCPAPKDPFKNGYFWISNSAIWFLAWTLGESVWAKIEAVNCLFKAFFSFGLSSPLFNACSTAGSHYKHQKIYVDISYNIVEKYWMHIIGMQRGN